MFRAATRTPRLRVGRTPFRRTFRGNATALAVTAVAGLATVTAVTTREPVDADTRPQTPQAPPLLDQVARFISAPGCFVAGDNSHGVSDPESPESMVRKPRRLAALDGVALRCLRVSAGTGIAVTDVGDVLQWNADDASPRVLLYGHDVTRVELGREHAVCLTRAGAVLTIPLDPAKQAMRPPTGWAATWFGRSEPSATPRFVTNGPRMADIAVGDGHVIARSRSGEAYACALTLQAYDNGQTGVLDPLHFEHQEEDLWTWQRISLPNDGKIVAVAAGKVHSVLQTDRGHVYTMGGNTYGQLGSDFTLANARRALPQRVALPGHATRVYAGGNVTYVCVQVNDSGVSAERMYACGGGGTGQLGSGTWPGSQGSLTRVKSVSDIFAFDEAAGVMRPVGIRDVSVSATHSAAVMATGRADDKTSKVMYGSDVFVWGENKTGQLGNGKRASMAAPMHMAALDAEGAASNDWLQLAPLVKVRLLSWRSRRFHNYWVEQAVTCGDGITAVYPRIVE